MVSLCSTPGEYPVLRAGDLRPEFEGKCALAIMAKAPRAGKVKTRLSPPLTLEQSAALNICFLRDTSANVQQVCASEHATGLVCYTPVGEESAFSGLLPQEFALIGQRGDGFGARLHAAAQDILSCGFSAVCLIDSDSPTVPQLALRQAVRELEREGDRIVLGGSADGGYYLIGLKQAHPEPFHCISWSTSAVFEETVERCAEAGIEVVQLPVWYDVDDAETLNLLEDELFEGKQPLFGTAEGFDAVATRAFLRARRDGLLTSSRDKTSADEVVA